MHKLSMYSGVSLFQVRVAANSRNSAWAAYDGRNRREIKQGDRFAVLQYKAYARTAPIPGHAHVCIRLDFQQISRGPVWALQHALILYVHVYLL